LYVDRQWQTDRILDGCGVKFFHQVYHLARADFLERVRRFSFLVVLALALFAGYMFVPPYDSSYTSFVVASHRGLYNSPWIGTIFGATSATILTLIGFYLVKNSISNDYRTRLGQIIATTPVGMMEYMIGKWLSNVLVLSAILGVLSIIAPIMQITRGEVTQINLLAIWTPLWLMGFPALVFISALAVLFESIALLRGGFGNIVYFFIWGPILVGSGARNIIVGNRSGFLFDFAGMTRVIFDIKDQLAAAGVDVNKGTFGIIGPMGGDNVTRIMWDGIPVSGEMIMERLIWIVFGIIAAVGAALIFNRFDPARNPMLARGGETLLPASNGKIKQISAEGEKEESYIPARLSGQSAVNLTAIDRNEVHSPFFSTVKAELLIMLKGHSRWWYLFALGLVVATPFIPLEKVAQFLFAAAWIWPILIWSSMGNRECFHRTQHIIFSAAYPIRRQLPAIWLAGVTVALVTGSGFAIRMTISGNWQNLYALLIGAVFVPTLALTFGVWTNGSRLFEVFYLIFWYISIQDGMTFFDYRGATEAAIVSGVPFIYLVMTIALMIFAVLGRQRQMRYLFG
jgi:hypothetical protein